MTNYRTRPAQLSDLEEICAIENDSFTEPYPRFLLRKLLNNHASTFLVTCDRESNLIGYCVSSIEERSAHLISIAVLSSHRRAGIGLELMESMLASLVKQGVEQIWLEVKIGNEEGTRLYSKLGFARESVVPRYYSDGSDALRMRKVLASRD